MQPAGIIILQPGDEITKKPCTFKGLRRILNIFETKVLSIYSKHLQ